MHALSWKVVAKPDESARLADLAATQVEWVLGHVDKRADAEVRPRPRDVRHALAVVRLRQGQPADVRRLWADALAADSLCSSARDEALELDPSADLVPEAVSMLGNGPPSLAATSPASAAGS